MVKVIANYKINYTDDKFLELRDMFNDFKFKKVEFVVCPPYSSLHVFKDSNINLGAQNMSLTDKKPTGEISGEILNFYGTKYVILGHSERRQAFKETDEIIHGKVLKALECGIKPIICIGETLYQKKHAKTCEVLEHQLTILLTGIFTNELKNITIAYEPIWAIGSGKIIKKNDLQVIVKCIKSIIEKLYGENFTNNIDIVYGGSINEENYKSIISTSGINGLLIGGASLNFDKLKKIIEGLNK